MADLTVLPAAERWRVSVAVFPALPSGWTRASVSDVASVQNGFPFDASRFGRTVGFPLVRIRDVGADDTSTLYDGPVLPEFLIDSGDILIGMDGEFRVRRWRGRPALLNQRVCRLSLLPHNTVDAQWLVWCLQPLLSAVEAATSSVTVKHLSSSTIRALEIPLPPLAEQRRIVAKLEALLGRIRRAREALDAVPAMVERYKKSVLGAAFPPGKTPEVALFQLLTEGPKNGLSVVESTEVEGQVTSLRLSATTSGVFVFSTETTKQLDIDIPDDSSLWLREGDILVQRANSIDHVGVAAFVDRLPQRSIYPDLMMRLRVVDCVDPRFVVHQMSSGRLRRWLTSRATGTAGNMPKVSGATLKQMPMWQPPLDEQRAIVTRIDAAFARARAMLSAADAARAQLDVLERSVLAKAFRGELVEQDPADEPASVMLDRVRAERAKSGAPAKKPRKPRASA